MPFHVADPVDPADYIRDQRRRAADRAIARLAHRLGDEVDVDTAQLPPGITLQEPAGIVVGVTAGDLQQYLVMCSAVVLGQGTEMALPFLAAQLRRR